MNATDPSELPQIDPTPPTFHSALLLGEDHTELEEVAITEVAPNLAIGISRGRFPKGYPHIDPNEDAAYAATDGTTTVLAVADGHQGFDAARAATSAIADTAPGVIDAPLEVVIRQLAGAAIDSGGRNRSDTVPTSKHEPNLPHHRSGARRCDSGHDSRRHGGIRRDPPPLETSRHR